MYLQVQPTGSGCFDYVKDLALHPDCSLVATVFVARSQCRRRVQTLIAVTGMVTGGSFK